MLKGKNLLFGFLSDDFLKLTHDCGEGVGTGGGAEHVVRRFKTFGPVSESFIAGFFKRPSAVAHGDDFRAHEFHTENIGLLALHVLGSHVDAAFQPQKGAHERCCHTVLAGTGFSDDAGFAHAFGQKRLSQYLIGFVRASVHEVFAL